MRYTFTYLQKYLLISELFLLPLTKIFGQVPQISKSDKMQLEISSYGSTNQVIPFWLRVNQWGAIPFDSPLVVGKMHYSLDYKRKIQLNNDSLKLQERVFAWGLGLTPIVNLGKSDRILLPEAYIKLKLGPMELFAGRWKHIMGIGDTTLSSGFIIMSGNAIPVPKVQLSTRGYVPLKFLNSAFALNIGYSHGWFLNTYIQSSYLHQKFAYLRIGKPSATLKIYLGMSHQAQWGGYADYLLGSLLAVNGKLPSSLNDYKYVALARRPKEISTANYTFFDGSYWIGNHIGANDLGIEFITKKTSLFAYYQHPFEDASGLFFQNIPDGLYGFSWRKLHLDKSLVLSVDRITLEYLSTMNQSGANFYQSNSNFQGKDNYFNHAQYKQGWSYQGRTLGNPIVAPYNELNPQIPISDYFTNNRIQLYYLGASGILVNKVKWTTRFGYSRHFGSYNYPFEKVLHQLCFLLSTQTHPFKSEKNLVSASISMDQGQLFPQTIGISLAMKYMLSN